MPRTKKKDENLNTGCPWSEPTCFKDFQCLLCSYQWMVDHDELDLADSTYVRWKSWFEEAGVERVGGSEKVAMQDRLDDNRSPGPSPSQLAMVAMLAQKAGVPPPKVDTAEEAVEIINTLKRKA